MAKAKKRCEVCGTEVWDLAAHEKAKHSGPAPADGTAPELDPPAPPETAEPPGGEASPGQVTETAPRKPKLMERIRSRRGRGRGGPTAAATRERPPRRPRNTGRRVALDTDISDIWAFGGRRLERTIHYPTGRMLEYQAPAAGIILDRAVAGSLPDRILFQPLARNRDKYEDVGFLLAGPVLTFAITTNGHQIEALLAHRHEWTEDHFAKYQELVGRQEMLKEMFTWVLSMMLPRLAEGKKKADEKKAKADAAIAEAFPDLGPDDPVDVLATMLFEPPTFEEAQTNGNGRHAQGDQPGDPAPAPGGESTFPL